MKGPTKISLVVASAALAQGAVLYWFLGPGAQKASPEGDARTMRVTHKRLAEEDVARLEGFSMAFEASRWKEKIPRCTNASQFVRTVATRPDLLSDFDGGPDFDLAALLATILSFAEAIDLDRAVALWEGRAAVPRLPAPPGVTLPDEVADRARLREEEMSAGAPDPASKADPVVRENREFYRTHWADVDRALARLIAE
ncbi:MAG: hypothetical protein HY720_20580 [Planctomycetes bacterium]|nr:hypothetical protein [Planctomycetota bacterium]